jgi:hypothetical protein
MATDPDAERFKWAMLRVAAGDPPWYTGMAWADAADGLSDKSPEDLGRIVREALLDLLDAGFIFFYRPATAEADFAQHVQTEGISRREVEAALADGGTALCFAATERGRDFFETLPEEASLLRFSPGG